MIEIILGTSKMPLLPTCIWCNTQYGLCFLCRVSSDSRCKTCVRRYNNRLSTFCFVHCPKKWRMLEPLKVKESSDCIVYSKSLILLHSKEGEALRANASYHLLDQFSALESFYEPQKKGTTSKTSFIHALGSFCGLASLCIAYNFLHNSKKCTQGRLFNQFLANTKITSGSMFLDCCSQKQTCVVVCLAFDKY